MNVMILAAGEGTRLRPFTLEKPKPAIPFLGAPLICYSLSLIEKLPVHNLVVNTFHLPDQIKTLLQDLKPRCNKLVITHEKDGLLGSGGGIHNAKEALSGKGDFIVMNGDEVILPHQLNILEEMISFHKWHKGIATLMTMKHPEVGSKFGGAWLDDSSKIQCFSKKDPGAPATRGLHFLGVMILSDRVFKYFKESVVDENILYETLTKAMSQGEEVHAFEVNAEWFETGNPQDFMQATEYCLKSLNQTAIDKRSVWQEHLLQTVRLHSNGETLLEKGSPIESEIKRSIEDWKID